jgi:hypothetical protein
MGQRWQVLLRPAVDRIERNLKAGLPAREAVTEAWKATGASAAITKELQRGVLQAAYSGAGGVDAVLSRPAFEQAVLGSTWAGDNIPTIVRLRNAPRQMQAAVTSSVRSAVIQGDSVRTLALKISDNFFARPLIPTMAVSGDPLPAQLLELTQRAVSGGLDPILVGDLRRFRAEYIDKIGGRFPDTSKLGAAYRELTQRLESGTDAQIASAIRAAVYHKARYLGERIARTEMARANFEGFAAQKFEDKQVAAIRFRLSPGHPKEDICDFICSVDNGWGAGVYKRDSLPPYPFHPNCICWFEEIYISEVSGKAWEGGTKPAQRLLQRQSFSSRAAMLGAKYRAKEFARNPAGVYSQMAQWKGLQPLKPVILPDMLK